ncbi:MAG: GNAT family N-acetyltransferase [Chloroflexi bacterium]|nr:GNAT family N-acetyltransferase [Chloroflexota bacterium]
MSNKTLLQLFDRQLRQEIEYPEARRETTKDVVRFVREAPGMNFISFTFAPESELDRVITRELEYFGPKQQPFTWKVCSHDPLQVPLAEHLEKHHFEADDEPGDFMVLDIKNAPSYLFEPGRLDIRRITDLAGLKDVIQVLDKVYGGSNNWVNGRLGGHLQIPGYLSVYTAYVDNQPVSIAWTYFQKGVFASLFAGSTLPEFRNRGLYTALLSTRLQEIRKRGYRYASVEAGPMSRPIVEKHGFQYLTTQTDYIWRGQAES